MFHLTQYIIALLAILIATMSFEGVYVPYATYSQQQEGSPSPAPRRVPQDFTPSQGPSPFDGTPTVVTTRPRLFTSDASTRPSLERFMKPKPEATRPYSESWQRLEKGEKLPAPPRPSSSDSSGGEYPPGKDRDFGWFARQRERDDKILALRRARHAANLTDEGKKRYDWKNWKQGKYVGPGSAVYEEQKKESVPPTDTTTHVEEFKENVPPTGTYIMQPTSERNYRTAEKKARYDWRNWKQGKYVGPKFSTPSVELNVPPPVSDSDSERTWDVDFTAQSVMTSPKMRIVEEVPAEDEPKKDPQTNFPTIMENPVETPGKEAEEPAPMEEEEKSVPAKVDVPKEAEQKDEMWETLRSLSRCSTPSNLSITKATPKVTGAYIETPAPERLSDPETFPEQDTPRPASAPAPETAGKYLKSPARRSRFTKPEPSIKQEAPTPAQEITGAYIETPAPRESPKKHEHEATEPTKPKLHISAKPPTFKEDLRRIKRETDYQDSTDDEAEAVIEPIADPTIDPDKVILGRMSQQLKMTSSSIRDARLGIERLEERVSASGAVYIRLPHIPRWLWMLLAIILALFVTVMAIGAYEEHMMDHVVPGSAADWWGGSNGPVVLSWSGGGSGSGGWKEQGFGADEYLF